MAATGRGDAGGMNNRDFILGVIVGVLLTVLLYNVGALT